MADLADQLEEAARRTAAARYAQARKSEQDPASFRFTTDKLVNFAKAEPQYAPYYREFLNRDKAPAYSLDELAAAAPAFAPKKIAAAIQQPTAGQEYSGAYTEGESLFPKPEPPKKPDKDKKPQPDKPQPDKPQPDKPQPDKPQPDKPVYPGSHEPVVNPTGRPMSVPKFQDPQSNLNNPALENFGRQLDSAPQGGDWRDRAVAQAESLQDQYHGQPKMTGYHWFRGTGGVSGGNDAGMIVYYSDGTSNWVPTSKPGVFPPVLQTTRQAQDEMLNRAKTMEGGGGGILPAWNSPTGQNEDLRAFGPKEVDTSAAGPTPPSGWLDRAITAARGGALTYDTGGTKDEGNIPTGGISTSRQGNTLIGTPSGGTIGLPNSTGATDRQNLIDAFNKSKTALEESRSAFDASKTASEDKRREDLYG